MISTTTGGRRGAARMTNQVGPATDGGSVAVPGSGAAGPTGFSGASAVAGVGSGGQDVAPFVSQVPGTPVSFPAGGFALVFGPIWWLFWVCVGVAVLGGLMSMATGIFDDWY